MTSDRPSLRFGDHLVAVLGGTAAGSIAIGLCWGAMLAIVGGGRYGASWVMMMTSLVWLGVFIIALPLGGLVLTLLWPVTRRGGGAAVAICLLAGVAVAGFVAPLSAGTAELSLSRLVAFEAIGAAIAGGYLIVAWRLAAPSARGAAVDPQAGPDPQGHGELFHMPTG